MSPLVEALRDTLDAVEEATQERRGPVVREVGRVVSVSGGVARVEGLPRAGSEEVIQFEGGRYGLAFNLDPGEVGVILLDPGEQLQAGDRARRTGRVLDVPVGEALLGRVVDALGRPLDTRGGLRAAGRRTVNCDAPAVLDRDPVTEPLHTGLKVVDALVPIGRGQRELILGDRQTGKTSLAVSTIINQTAGDVHCVYCAVGQRQSSVAGIIEDLRRTGALAYTTVVVAGDEDPPGQRFVAPYAATSMAEYFRDRGEDALVVFDDLTRHARTYRELSLLLRRPPGREAFPGDIFYLHSRLLERSTHLREVLGGGSLTALPIVETEEQNIAGYIPTNLISITDGQIYLSPDLFQKGVLPAVDVGRSVSRVGGKTQLPAYRSVAGDLRLTYSQFQELESFAHFGARLEEETRRTLERGRRVREVLKQDEHDLLRPAVQLAVLLAVTEGIFDDYPLDGIAAAGSAIRHGLPDRCPDLCRRIEAGQPMTGDDRRTLLDAVRSVLDAEA